MAFTGKVVLITGASSGIGAETAIHFSTLGASLVIVGRNAEALHEVAEKCAKNTKITPLSVVADVTKDTQKIISQTIGRFGQIDVLINIAGKGHIGNIENTTMEAFDDIMSTNLRSVFALTSLATPYLLTTKGNIVNVSSVAGIRAFPNAVSYCVSKAALDQFTKCVALELAPKGVRVNSVNPAVIVTNFHKNSGMDEAAYAKYLESSKATHALGRPGTPDEVAAAIAFLANNAVASFITGTLLAVDGGKASMCPR